MREVSQRLVAWLSVVFGEITQNMYRCVLLQIFSEMHIIEGLKLVLYRISIENNKKISSQAQKMVFDTFKKDFTLPDVPP